MAAAAQSSRVVSRNFFLAVVVLVGLVSFVAGTRQQEIYSAAAGVFGVRVSTDTIDVSSLQDTYRRLQESYDGELDVPSLVEGANRGLVEAVGDKYTEYFSKSDAEEFDKDLEGNIGGGIGAEIGVRNDQPTILRTLANTPAEKAGLKAGDVIVKVNSKETDRWNSHETAMEIRGEIGTTVKITVIRDGKEKLDFSITRAEITSPSVEAEVKDDIGVLEISRFDKETLSLAKEAARDFKQQGVKGVVVDLRGNGGGYLEAARVADIWLNNKVIVSERSGGQLVEELRSGRQTILEDIPTVVLVNGSSASASEIVAGALQDHGVARIIGEKTYGKGTVQQLISLGKGAKLKVTVARWFTPSGRSIEGEGVEPDKVVEMTSEDSNAGKDPQMEAAFSELKRR